MLSLCLLKKLLDRDTSNHAEKTIYSFFSPSSGFREKPEDQALQSTRTLINQLFDDSKDRLRHAMHQYPASEITKRVALISKPEHETLKNLFTVLTYSLAAIPRMRINLIVDGVDVLGTEMYRFLENLLDMNRKLRDNEANTKVLVKIFFSSRLVSLSEPLNDLEQSLTKIPSIEKDKELNGTSL